MTENIWIWNKYDILRKSPEVPVKRWLKVARKERAFELNPPWDSIAMGWKMCYPYIFASLRLGLPAPQQGLLGRRQTEQKKKKKKIIIL